MILAGIDEAGLGPAIGPLCVCAAVLRLETDSRPSSGTTPTAPEVLAARPWELLAGLAGRSTRDKTSPLLITDSKIAHKARGVAGLEAAALSFWLAAYAPQGAWPQSLNRSSLLDASGAGDCLSMLPLCPWYAEDDWRIPAHAGKELILSCARQISAHPHLRVEALRARVLTEKMLNDLFARGLNKSEALLLQTGAQIRFIYEKFPNEDLLIMVDKQGGRNFYAPYLSETLGGAWVQTICEGADLSEYVLGRLRVRFLPKADAEAFPVALASLYAKYLREQFMDSFNAWFAQRMPGLEPTAGYHGDAPRFLDAVRPLLLQHHLPQELIWRER